MHIEPSSLRNMVALLRREATPFVKWRLAYVFLLAIVSAILTALGPLALKLLVDAFTAADRQRMSALLLVTLYVISQWMARVFGEIQGMVYRRVQRRVFRTLSERLFVHLLHLPLRFHLDRQTGALSETLASGLEGLQLVLNHLVVIVLPVVVQLATVLVVILGLTKPPFFALFSAALLLYALAFGCSANAVCKCARTASAARVNAGATMTDGLLNYEIIKYFAAESLMQKRVGDALARSEIEWASFSRLFARNGVIVATIYAAFLAATSIYATLDVLHGTMTIGEFVLVNTYIVQLFLPLEVLGSAIQSCFQGVGMLGQLMRLFREKPEFRLPLRAGLHEGNGSLIFDRVSFSYRRDHRVLRELSFRIPPKRTLAIVGSSGSGKSTIVRLLMRLLEPDEGQILLDDVPVSTIDLHRLRSIIAVVPQDTVLFNETISYNIAFGSAHATDAEVQHAAQIARLHEFIMTLPDGYNTQVGERGVKLSGGERQRVSIARAVLKRPRIYVFDEATSSLDTQTEQDILSSFREIAKHSSTLVIAHRLSTVLHADEIVLLENGEILERDNHVSLLERNGRYAALWHAQQRGTAA